MTIRRARAQRLVVGREQLDRLPVIDAVLETCDAEGIPAFLESSKERNISYYERFGFEVTGEERLPKGGPPFWTMWREPRPR